MSPRLTVNSYNVAGDDLGYLIVQILQKSSPFINGLHSQARTGFCFLEIDSAHIDQADLNQVCCDLPASDS